MMKSLEIHAEILGNLVASKDGGNQSLMQETIEGLEAVLGHGVVTQLLEVIKAVREDKLENSKVE